MSMLKGQKIKLEDNIINNQTTVQIKYEAPFIIDISCFGLDVNDKLSNEDYMVFYNQKNSLQNEISLSINDKESIFLLNLSKLPTNINKLVFTAAIDDTSTQAMNSLGLLEFTMNEHIFSVKGSDFSQEKAIMVTEIYKKDGVWRLSANGQGFKGGLADLLTYFGGSSVESTANSNLALVVENPQPIVNTVKKVSLEKRFEEKAPKLVNLAKIATVSLEKNNLAKVKAKTAFVLDASGSMTHQYKKGQVQETVYRMFPLGVHFDDDEQLETWAFALKSKKISNVNFANYEKYVSTENGGWQNWMRELNAGYNNEPAVILDVIKHFTGLTPTEPTVQKTGFFSSKVIQAEEFAPAITSKTPIFVLFVSDGGVDKDAEIERLIKWSSTLPIFWQFIGIGGSNYGALERLDDMPGRYLDNADFFAIDDLEQLTEAQLYDRMMTEFPKWLEAAYKKGLIDNYKV
jgi:stress response protein SCP2